MWLYRDNGKENRICYVGFRVWGLGPFQGDIGLYRGHIRIK